MKYIEKMTGYKATNKNMECKGYKFKIGVWYEEEGDIVECKKGFHFCEQLAGVFSYYKEMTDRVFKIEAEQILDTERQPGSDYKRVAKRIRFVEEIKYNKKKSDKNTGDRNTGDGNTGNMNTGHRNTGDRNTGYGNTGDGNTGNMNTGNMNTGDWNTGYGNTGNMNTGHRNTGDRNTGDGNTGDRNTGYGNTGNGNTGDSNTGHRNTGDGNTGDGNTGHRNTGDMNTGDMNTGDSNTGDMNTGDGNTGHRNTGDRNTGDMNTGDRNTGHGNACNYSSGFFCTEEHPVFCFDINTGISRSEFIQKYPEYYNLCQEFMQDEKIDFEKYKNIPGITKDKLKSLHDLFIKKRKSIIKRS